MNLTKRQKMLSAVFLLGVGGLVVDRTLLRPQGGPQAASARAQPAASAAPAAESTPVRAPLAERLNNLLVGRETAPKDLRDPFSLPATWSETGPANGERTPDTVREFLRKHRLKAVVIKAGESCAEVDDTYLAPGGYLDGFRLVSVDQRSAVFAGGGKQVVLHLVVE
jgi:hypothetical protein